MTKSSGFLGVVGYHICLTRRRPPVQVWQKSFFKTFSIKTSNEILLSNVSVAKRGALVLNVVIKVIKVIGKNDQADLTII